jgi:hypothetical protein
MLMMDRYILTINLYVYYLRLLSGQNGIINQNIVQLRIREEQPK